ncbi:UNVERIFIED_ORG: hypothetical protein J2W19_003119 [Shinella zoogloeoides]|nr:hypothetical protein [Shinella zoogloeoides]
MTVYTTGTITLTNGSAVVTGTDTAWQLALIVGGTIFVQADGGNPLPIASVENNTQILAALQWTGDDGTYAYAIQPENDVARVAKNAETLARIIAEMDSGVFWKYDQSGDTAGRALYDTREKGFSYLDVSKAQVELWVKRSATAGDWAGPFAYGTGPIGPPPTLAAGAVTTRDPDQNVTASVSGSNGTYLLNLGVPRGVQGYKGWAIETELVPYGPKTVVRVSDFIGGEGTKPAGTGLYVGTGGLVSNIDDAVNVRGGEGARGPRGVTFRGPWSSTDDYAIGDIVIDEDVEAAPATYIATGENTNLKPRENPAEWAFFPGSVPQTINDGLWGDTITETANDGVWGA